MSKKTKRRRRSDTGPTEEIPGLSAPADLIDYLTNLRANPAAIDVEELPAAVGLVGLFSDVSSSFPLVGVDAATKEPLTEQPDTFVQPDPTEEVSETVENIAQSLFWDGNAYGLVDDEWPHVTVRIVNPNTVGCVVMPNDDRAVDHWLVNGTRYEVDEVAHWKINDDPRRGPLGRSPAKQCAAALATFGAAYTYLAGYFGEGGIPSAYFQAKRQMDPEDMRTHRDEWIANRRRHRFGVVPFDLDLTVPPTPSETDHVLSVLEAASSELGRVFRVPPSISGAAMAGYSLTYTNVADDLRRWLAIGLGPTWLRAIERGFTKLAPRGIACRADRSQGWLAELLAANPPTASQEVAA